MGAAGAFAVAVLACAKDCGVAIVLHFALLLVFDYDAGLGVIRVGVKHGCAHIAVLCVLEC